MYQKFTQKLLPNETEDVQIEPSLRQVGAYAILTGLKGPSPFNSLLCVWVVSSSCNILMNFGFQFLPHSYI